MADTRNMNNNQTSNQTMQHEQAKASVSGNSQSDRSREQGGLDRDRQEKGEKSAIGGGTTESREQGPMGQSGQNSMSQTGEPGRARSELNESGKEPAGR